MSHHPAAANSRRTLCAALVLAVLSSALLASVAAADTKYPTAPEENLMVLKLKHRDAGEVARIVEDVLRQSIPEGQMNQGVITVDPRLNAIVVRAAGPGATWPTTVKNLVAQLDQPTETTGLSVTFWRTGWGSHPPRTAEEKAEARAVLGDNPGEKLDTFRIPVETGTYFSGWLNAPGKPAMRVVGVVGANQGKARTIRVVPLRVELVESLAGAPPPGGAPGAAPGAAPAETGAPESEGKVILEPAPGAPPKAGEKPAVAPPAAPPISGNPEAQAPPPRPEEPTPEATAPEGQQQPAALLPPPYGEVVFAGPVTAEPGAPAVIGPFSVPGMDGQFLVAVEATSATGGSESQ